MANNQWPKVTDDGEICIVEDEQGATARFPRYRHTPLSSKRKIRLLKHETPTQPWPLSSLSQSNECSLIEYELETADVTSLDVSSSPYVAMSYFWGEAKFKTPLIVIVEGERTVLPVTQTAWEALQRTLPAIGRFGKLMWIDQICIDQDNNEEKTQQVGRMGDIYRQCLHCMIWLGPAEKDTLYAFSLLRRLQEVWKHDQPFPLNAREAAVSSHVQLRAQLTLKMGCDVIPAITDPGWIEIARLLQREWFSRLWTFQEAVLCHKGDATIRCGEHHTPLITFMRGSMLLGNERSFVGLDYIHSRAALSQISITLFDVANNRKTPLICLLSNNALRNCTNPRDRVFALLGLRNEDGPDYAVPVNYRKSPEQLFIEVTRSIIQAQGSLRICAEAPERVQNVGLTGLPSWVPDWTRQPLNMAFETFDPLEYYFRASNRRVHIENVKHTMILQAQGKIVDRVVQIIDTKVPDDMTDNERRIKLTENVLPRLHETLRSKNPEMHEEKLSHMIVNTISLGGHTWTRNIGDFCLPSDAWSALVCAQMLRTILKRRQPVKGSGDHVDVEQWLNALSRAASHCAYRQFAVLQNYPLGLLPGTSSTDDSIAILHGSSLPFVLRPAANGCYKMIGVSYVDGIMHGETVDWETGDTFHIC